MSEGEAIILRASSPGAPACMTCGRRAQLAIEIGGETLYVGSCGTCADARGEGWARWRAGREASQRQEAELAKREREGLPVVARPEPERGFRR